MIDQPLLTLCIPTNGVLHWVKPVIESIYSQDVDPSLYEVVVTDNGSNLEFKEFMRPFAEKHNNLNYTETNAQGFLNQKEAFKLSKGKFIKFINHRMPLKKGSMKYFLDFVQAHKDDEEKPIIYFSNGALHNGHLRVVDSFDLYIKTLDIFSSWSAGLAFWRDDYNKIPEDLIYNNLFPHTDILFSERHRQKYFIDDHALLDTLPVGKTSKGHYDLYYAFAVEYPTLLLNLVTDGDVSIGTFLQIKKSLLRFLAEQYFNFNIRNKPCSYDLNGFDQSVQVYFSKRAVEWKALGLIPKRTLKKIFRMMHL